MKYEFPANTHSSSYFPRWTCDLLSLKNSVLTDYKSEAIILTEIMNDLRIKKFSPEIFNILPTGGVYFNILDEDVQACEMLYYSLLQKINSGALEVNADGNSYGLVGLDSCQVSEILQIPSSVETLKSNQFILTPSACERMELGENYLFNKPYFLTTVYQYEKKIAIDIELLNSGSHWSWIDM